jgi:hypothetical protein
MLFGSRKASGRNGHETEGLCSVAKSLQGMKVLDGDEALDR